MPIENTTATENDLKIGKVRNSSDSSFGSSASGGSSSDTSSNSSSLSSDTSNSNNKNSSFSESLSSGSNDSSSNSSQTLVEGFRESSSFGSSSNVSDSSNSSESSSGSESFGSDSSAGTDRTKDLGPAFKKMKKMGVVGHVIPSLEEKLKEHIEEANMQVPDANVIETVKKKKMKMMKMMKMMMGMMSSSAAMMMMSSSAAMMMMKKKKKKMSGKKKKMMGGPGPGPGPGKKKMMGGPGKKKKPSSTKWRLVEYTAAAGGGCSCFRADKAPDPNNATVAHITTYNSATECGNAANICRDNCAQQMQVMKALKENIKNRESNGENSTALLDAKELFKILQKRHSIICKKHKQKQSSSSSTNPSASLASSANGSLRALPRAAELSAEITGRNPQKKKMKS